MGIESILQSAEIQKQNKKILLEVALFLNKQLFDERKITYRAYKYTEESILKKIKSAKDKEM